MRSSLWLAAMFVLLLAARLAHQQILWPEETLPLAAAGQMLLGKTLYRDVWFDKPPLLVLLGVAQGARDGVWLRFTGALFLWSGCLAIYQFGRKLWGERAGLAAAGLLALFLTFYIHAAVIPLAADLAMLPPHILAVYFAWRGRGLAAGLMAGACFLVNAKALFVLASCALFVGRVGLAPLSAGFLLVLSAAAGVLYTTQSLNGYAHQVVWWSSVYSANTFLDNPLTAGLRRWGNWFGFHAGLIVGTAAFLKEKIPERRSFLLWLALSGVAVAAGLRFFPRYYFQILPVLVLAAAYGITRHRRIAMAVGLLLIVPVVRFGPKHVELALDLAAGREHTWGDVAMDRDSRDAAWLVGRGEGTLVVWGYRPEIFIYTGRASATRFLESQPLTGVFADRHLFDSSPVETEAAEANRRELASSTPEFIVDGVTKYNPDLSITKYRELAEWLANYSVVAETRGSVIYKRSAATKRENQDHDNDRDQPNP